MTRRAAGKRGAVRPTSIIGTSLLLLMLAGAGGCNRYDVIPDALEGQVDRDLSFTRVKSDPDRFTGRTVVWGGEVLKAERLRDRTEVELLQLPLNGDLIPAEDRPSSQGRFIAVDRQGEIIDPAILKEGTRVTVIGEIQGSMKEAIGESQYRYPILGIRDMTVWDRQQRGPYPVGVYGYPYYYGYGYYAYRPYTFWRGSRVPGGSPEEREAAGHAQR